MEGEHNDLHSDSDSGDSWTLLDASPAYTNDTPAPAQESHSHAPVSVAPIYNVDGLERDEDTDGISIISDCESESTCEHVDREEILLDQTQEITHQSDFMGDYISVTPDPFNSTESEESRFDDILGDTSKLKTYVHRRNNKVSSMLNVIMLGSVITAAGIALGHIWGVRDDCSQQTTPSVNKILSNLYKLQEENAFLRSKLKELTLASHSQVKKKISSKSNKCKKVFEEPLQKVNVDKITKCVDPDVEVERPLVELIKTDISAAQLETGSRLFKSSVDEIEFKNDLLNLKQIYSEHKKWLDKEIAKRMKNEKYLAKSQKILEDTVPLEQIPKLNMNAHKEHKENVVASVDTKETDENKRQHDHIIVSYADSLKHGSLKKRFLEDEDNIQRIEEIEIQTNRPYKKKYKPNNDKINLENYEDDDSTSWNDNQFSNKRKDRKPKKDRQKQYRKHKRENKYEQWEMKGGYLKNYDSVASLTSQENLPSASDYNNNHYSADYDMYLNYVHKLKEGLRKNADKKLKKENKNDYVIVNKTERDDYGNMNRMKESATEITMEDDWFQKRSSMRKKAREELEKKFPANRKFLKMNARWYFRRMSERESLRAHAANATHKKDQRRNYKARR